MLSSAQVFFCYLTDSDFRLQIPFKCQSVIVRQVHFKIDINSARVNVKLAVWCNWTGISTLWLGTTWKIICYYIHCDAFHDIKQPISSLLWTSEKAYGL